MARYLFLCRHAKSSWKNNSLADIDRPLNKRGIRNAPEMGRRLARRHVRPEMILTSPAVRALATAISIARELGLKGGDIRVVKEMYDTFPAGLLRVVRGQSDSCQALMLVGHNPEITVLANILGGLHIDNIPTCGVVGLDFHVDVWQDIDEDTGKVLFFDYPRNADGGDLS